MFKKIDKLLLGLMILILLMTFSISVIAADTVKIGAVYPMTGPAARGAEDATNAIKLALDIVNNEYPDLDFSLAPTSGLPNLDGAKIEVIYGNSQAKPEFGKAEVERLITINKVSAIIGCYNSSVTKVGSQVSERFKTPMVTGTSTAADLTERGLKYYFRVTGSDKTFSKNMIDLIEDLNQEKDANIKNIALLYDDTEYGVGMFDYAKEALANRDAKLNVVKDVKYAYGSGDLDSEVLVLKQADPDFILAAFQTDVLNYLQSCKKFDFNIKIGQAGDFSGIQEVIAAMGKDANYLITRDVFSLELFEKKPLLRKVNEMYKERYGKDLDADNSRAFVAMMVLADAINRAGSPDREAIHNALIETNIPSDQLILGWKGVKFDEKGQNIYGEWIFRQVIDGELVTVWPFELASQDIVFPLPKWNER